MLSNTSKPRFGGVNEENNMETETIDTYLSHNAYHQSYHRDCSECYKENRLIKSFKLVNGMPMRNERSPINNSSN